MKLWKVKLKKRPAQNFIKTFVSLRQRKNASFSEIFCVSLASRANARRRTRNFLKAWTFELWCEGSRRLNHVSIR